MDACAVELQNFENQVAKLRGHGERLQLPITLIQEAYKLEVRAEYSFHLTTFDSSEQCICSIKRLMVVLYSVGLWDSFLSFMNHYTVFAL